MIIRLPAELDEWYDARAAEREQKKSEIIRAALREYRQNHRREILVGTDERFRAGEASH